MHHHTQLKKHLRNGETGYPNHELVHIPEREEINDGKPLIRTTTWMDLELRSQRKRANTV
jgi:hypothetical protein